MTRQAETRPPVRGYSMEYYDDYDYTRLQYIQPVGIPHSTKKAKVGEPDVSNLIIMADTETSKNARHKNDGRPYENHLVAWTISIRGCGHNLVTLWGNEPRSIVIAIERIYHNTLGTRLYIFFHNLPYDWTFLRQFFFDRFGFPENELNVKPHYPISINFQNRIFLRDSLILAQRSLAKWANDLNVEHKKATGLWDYNKIRNQGGTFTAEELEYIEHDTLAGVECLQVTMDTLGDNIATLPMTATGIVRREFRNTARRNHGREWFRKMELTYNQMLLAEQIYHGGYTHQNRFLKNTIITKEYTNGENVKCYDIASSYPFVLCSELYPGGKFYECKHNDAQYILDKAPAWAFMFWAGFTNIRLKDPSFAMPVLQASKCTTLVGELRDNGRIVEAEQAVIALNEIDFTLIAKYYIWDDVKIMDAVMTMKRPLPKWFTDFVFQFFRDKTQLKGGDPVLYALKKAMLNSIYGMCVQHTMKDDICENYNDGSYYIMESRTPDDYAAYLKSRNSIMPYQIGVWCTSYAMKNLFELGACVGKDGEWIYSDTDSCFGYGWDMEKLKKYNADRIAIMRKRGYNSVKCESNGKTYNIGIAELDKECSEFVGIHSKCYSYRDANSGELKITVAGVPKANKTTKEPTARLLQNDLQNFRVGFVFKGEDTGKLLHTYFYNSIHTDEDGNEIGDSVDLSPCDYEISDVNSILWKMADMNNDEFFNFMTTRDIEIPDLEGYGL